MKTVKILESFEGWPTGQAPVRYVAGQQVEVSNEFADLIVGKGHAKEVISAKAAPASEEPADVAPRIPRPPREPQREAQVFQDELGAPGAGALGR
ncbi:hypothetical protein [Methylobacterium nodulans]|uniref:Uncharacterized protein n=1 Tax=Methylobacterium nodulans (strain LMG 21967 / CNCM I-2342 / ORS 2060) TaxID=460265 RepID=B8ITN2_METNO|nr:hypothetical protein [Methylobacterium nodulans]ACL58948.1 hypothetical protein Mnod_4069 [Methylobacterium nodulans ORS 2060]